MSFLSHLSPIRSFPDYTGPYTVGSCDIEVPVSSLKSPAKCPDDTIGTVLFRVFYPCDVDSSSRPIRWIPTPQSKYGAAYCRFMGAGPWLSSVMGLVPRFLYMTRIPAQRNAKLLQPSTASGRWPVLMFSHGLGGSRNAYSHICGSLASYGIIVVAPDHRDSSAPISFIRATNRTEAKMVGYKKLSHTPSAEVYQARDDQLRIRLWELGCIHDAIVRMDIGQCPENLDPNNASSSSKRTEVLEMFKGKMDLHDPGSIAWAGHSFGAATVVQLLKSVYYGPPSSRETSDLSNALLLVDPASELSKQITSRSVTLLLDTWCLPLRSPTTRWLWNQPLPCYDTSSPSSQPAGGKAIIAVESEGFVKWAGNFNDTESVISPKSPAPSKSLQWDPYFFYPSSSAHLSQSDFGILFPWILKRALKAEEPERLLRLNARAMLEMLRVNGFEVAPPATIDLEDGLPSSAINKLNDVSSTESVRNEKPLVLRDKLILTSDSSIRGWNRLEIEAFRIRKDDESSHLHVEEDYQNPSSDMDEAEVLDFQGVDQQELNKRKQMDAHSEGEHRRAR